MFYLLFRYSLADTKKLYEEFKSKEDVIEFIKKKRDEIEIDKVFEPGREFKLNWTLILEEIGKPALRRRGRPRKEAVDLKIEKDKAKPEKLESKEALEKADEYEEEPDEEPLEEADEFEEEPDEEEQEESKEEEIETVEKLEKMKKEKKKKLGRCKRKSCLKVFELEDWQHSTLHWCPECRLRPDYKNYDKEDGLRN